MQKKKEFSIEKHLPDSLSINLILNPFWSTSFPTNSSILIACKRTQHNGLNKMQSHCDVALILDWKPDNFKIYMNKTDTTHGLCY